MGVGGLVGVGGVVYVVLGSTIGLSGRTAPLRTASSCSRFLAYVDISTSVRRTDEGSLWREYGVVCERMASIWVCTGVGAGGICSVHWTCTGLVAGRLYGEVEK